MAAVLAAIIVPVLASNSFGAAKDYRFELAGTAQKERKGTSIVSVKLVHLPDNKPVPGAIVIESRADMSPIGMAAMKGPTKALGEQPPGTYRFEVDNGSVWKKSDNWALTLAAKVQGESETVRGSIVVRLEP
jgi:hypothetical protein